MLKMKLRKALKVISMLAVLGIVFGAVAIQFKPTRDILIQFGSIAFQFKPTRQILIQIASIYPFSAIINRLQHYGIPSNNAECLEELKQRDVSYKKQANFSNKLGCKVEYAVRLARVGEVTLDNIPLLTCRMAMQLSKFEEDYLQRRAMSVLGSKVQRIQHMGTYNCRAMRQFKNTLSQHSFANAIDVSGFVLADGTTINVAKDWKGTGKKSKFLKEVAGSACHSFRVSVSPDGDASHWDHFHWDAGPFRSCR